MVELPKGRIRRSNCPKRGGAIWPSGEAILGEGERWLKRTIFGTAGAENFGQ